ncbi:fasciclin domain-containing protein [Pleomorphovibrio marinus]|uniref:fasciclin domain-containing protein n=1 Tax=Pleomorphovibrio marinus TaxID=2164132 RepID=UPI000E0A3CCF|nr:fasciclin domain-containing protein [Pleomorphovibrio marinus]
MKFIYNISYLIAFSAFLFTGCIDDNFEEPVEGRSERAILSNVIAQQSELSIFRQLVEEEGLLGELVGTQTQAQRAVFAPTDNAILNFIAENNISSADDIEGLREILEYHIANPNITQSTLSQTNFNFIQTISDQHIFINRAGGTIRFNNQNISIVRSETGNGTVHLIDQVLLPRQNSIRDYLENEDDVSIFLEVVDLLGLEGQLSADYRTFFVPTNEAFANLLDDLEFQSLEELVEELGDELLEDIVRYHIINNVIYSANVSNGQALTPQFQGEVRPRVSTADGAVRLTFGEDNSQSTLVNVNDDIFRSGFVHKIDRVMLPVVEEED